MVLVSAVRNVVRGTELAVGLGSEIVQRFSKDYPNLKTLRDRFEHYEDYLKGDGNAQRAGGRRNGEALNLNGKEGIWISASGGGGREGHLVKVVVLERDENDEAAEVVYEAPSRTIVAAARRLARDLVVAAGMVDHLDACESCAAAESS